MTAWITTRRWRGRNHEDMCDIILEFMRSSQRTPSIARTELGDQPASFLPLGWSAA
jgi:hypothetical protein